MQFLFVQGPPAKERESLENLAHGKGTIFEFLPAVWADAQSECKDVSKQAQ